MYGECAHEQHVRRTLTLTLTHTITAYSVLSGNVVGLRVRILICATRQKLCRNKSLPHYRSSLWCRDDFRHEISEVFRKYLEIRKRVINFCKISHATVYYRWTNDISLRANIGWKSAFLRQRGQLDPTFQVVGATPVNHSSSQKTRLNDLSYGVKIWTDLSSVLSQCTRLTDGQTDTFLVASPRWHSMQRGKNWPY